MKVLESVCVRACRWVTALCVKTDGVIVFWVMDAFSKGKIEELCHEAKFAHISHHRRPR